jgi:hypothetical protein
LDTSVDEATLDVALRLADLAPPKNAAQECWPIWRCWRTTRRSCGGWTIRTDPAELIAP